MNSQERTSIHGIALVAALGLITASQTFAREQIVDASNDPSVPSQFTLDFGPGLGRTTAGITKTNYEIAVDRNLRTARFVSYNQEIDPLILPGGFSTGNIIVEVVPGSSSGTFNPETGEFNTSETYAIFFEGDLSAFQLESPVLLPSTSTGRINFGRARAGNIQMNWFGGSELVNPFDPTSFIGFTYVCEVNTVFGPQKVSAEIGALLAAAGDLGLDPANSDRYANLLQSASDQLAAGNVAGAVSALTAFVRTVKSDRGTVLTAQESDQFASQGLSIIRSLMTRLNQEITTTDGVSARSVSRR